MMEVLLITMLGFCVVSSQTLISLNKDADFGRKQNYSDNVPADCNMTVCSNSVSYFKSLLNYKRPFFIHFRIEFDPPRQPNVTRETFQPSHWVWTFESADGMKPYLSWGNDYALLSFGFLNTRTLDEIPVVRLSLPDHCPVTFGDFDTTNNIASALQDMTTDNSSEYEVSYYCFWSEVPNVRNTAAYTAALYFMYPVDFINYNCCTSRHSYVNVKTVESCNTSQEPKWPQVTVGPYVFGLIILMYFPIVMFKIAEWVSRGENVDSSEYEIATPSSVNTPDRGRNFDFSDSQGYVVTDLNDWIYLDGSHPYTFSDLFSTCWTGIKQKHPISFSRCRRLISLLLVPSVVYLHAAIYHFSDLKELVNELIDHKAPLGFVSLVSDQQNRAETLAPLLGGPSTLLLVQQILGLLFIVFPRCFKQIIEEGMPSYTGELSPLFLSADQIIDLSMVQVDIEAGYKKGAILCVCGIYLLFSKRFWREVVKIQMYRLQRLCCISSTFLVKLLTCILIPIYITICLLEIFLCVIGYGIPMSIFASIMIRGASKALLTVRLRAVKRILESSRLVRNLIFNPLTLSMLTCVVFAAFVYFTYASCLIFIDGFVFIAQVMVFTFVAVLMFPSVAFGNLFFFALLVYYLYHLIQSFGEVYLELLANAVDISRNLNHQKTSVVTFEGQLIISNLSEYVKNVFVNDRHLPLPDKEIQYACSEFMDSKKIKLQDDKYGIPKRLFEHLIKNYRPPNQYVLHIILKFISVCGLTAFTINYMTKYLTGPATDISKVMHVVFVVIIGAAAPRLLEMAMSNAKTSIRKEAEFRRLKRVIEQFYEKRPRNL